MSVVYLLIYIEGHEVAVAHNDKSVMENFHCVQAFKILYSAKNDFLENLSLVEYLFFFVYFILFYSVLSYFIFINFFFSL